MRVPKVECQECFSRRRVAVSFAEPHKQHTRAFERYVVELLRFMTPQDVSRHLGISWDLANDIQKRRLKRKFGRPKLKHLKRLAVDEVYVGKRHKYRRGAHSGDDQKLPIARSSGPTVVMSANIHVD